jgi:hypothetical protein
MPEQASQESSAVPPRKGTGLAAKARAHKGATALIAVAGFLGLGGILGQCAVNNISTAVRGERPPVGFEELHAAWQDTASLNERLLAAGSKVNKDLEKGTSFTGRIPPPELQDDLAELRAVRYAASDLTGRVRATNSDLLGPRDDVVQLVTLLRDTTQRVEAGVLDAYHSSGGQPIHGGSGGFAPIFSNELRDDVSKQNELVRQVAAGLEPIARRFERAVPNIRGWNRLAYPYEESDTPNY